MRHRPGALLVAGSFTVCTKHPILLFRYGCDETLNNQVCLGCMKPNLLTQEVADVDVGLDKVRMLPCELGSTACQSGE